MPLTDQERADHYLNEVREQYESIVPGARGRYMETCATMAVAFYLKAVLEKLNGDFLNTPLNAYGEGIGDAIQGQFVRGMAGISQYDR